MGLCLSNPKSNNSTTNFNEISTQRQSSHRGSSKYNSSRSSATNRVHSTYAAPADTHQSYSLKSPSDTSPYQFSTRFARFHYNGNIISVCEDGIIKVEKLVPFAGNGNASQQQQQQENSQVKKLHCERRFCLQDKSDGTAVSCMKDCLITGHRNGNILLFREKMEASSVDWGVKPEGGAHRDGTAIRLPDSISQKEHNFSVASLEFCPFDQSPRRFLSGGRDQMIRLWDLESFRVASKKTISRNLITDFCWLNADSFVQVGEDKRIRVFDSRDMTQEAMLWQESMIITSCDAFIGSSPSDASPANQFLATQKGSTSACSVFVFDIRKPNEVVRELKGHSQAIIGARYLNSHTICSVSNDRTIRIWDTQSSTERSSFSIDSSPMAITAVMGEEALISNMEGAMRIHGSEQDEWKCQYW